MPQIFLRATTQISKEINYVKTTFGISYISVKGNTFVSLNLLYENIDEMHAPKLLPTMVLVICLGRCAEVKFPLAKVFWGSDRTMAAKCNGLQRIMRTIKPLRNIEGH